MLDNTKYYIDQYDLAEVIKKYAQQYKKLRDYIDASIADQGKIFPSSVTVTPGEISNKTVPLTITATFDEPITDTNNPYKSGTKGMRYMVDGTVYNIPYNDIKISGNIMTAKVNYTAANYGTKNIVVIADTDKLNHVEGSAKVNVIRPSVRLTFAANADTNVKVYYTKESYDNKQPGATILLTANQERTNIYDRESIYIFKFADPSTIISAKINGALLNCSGLFSNCINLTSLDLSHLNTSNVTDMSSMFYNCSGLTSLDLSHLNTINVTDMRSMFYNCSRLTSLDLSPLDTSKVTDMRYMFFSCSGLTSLDLSHLNTINVTDMNSMFYNCRGLATLNLSYLNTSKVTDMSSMFHNCRGLATLNLSHLNTSKVTDMSSMFYNCRGLATIGPVNNAPGWQHKPNNYSNMFMYCPANPKPTWYQ